MSSVCSPVQRVCCSGEDEKWRKFNFSKVSNENFNLPLLETALCDSVKRPWSDCFNYDTLKLKTDNFTLHYITLN